MIFVSLQKLKKHVEKKEHERLRKQNEVKKEKVSTVLILGSTRHWSDGYRRSTCQSFWIFWLDSNHPELDWKLVNIWSEIDYCLQDSPSKQSTGKKSVTVAVAKKMIRDRINEILKWQMQTSHVEELQTAVNEAGEAEEDNPKSIPFNLDNFCTVIFECTHLGTFIACYKPKVVNTT